MVVSIGHLSWSYARLESELPRESDQEISRIVRRFDARIVEVNPTYTIVEKTGITADVIELFNQLDNLGCVLQFVRSGRIAITKSCIERLDQYIAQREEDRENA